MMKPLVVVALVVVAASGCERTSPAAPPPARAPVSSSPSPSPSEQAASLDTRTPVPLVPMMAQHQKEEMREHLGVVQAVVSGLARNDWAGIAEAAGKLGSSDPMAAMCTHMGAAAKGFTPTALDFHRTADGIVAAAKKKDRAAVLTALDATLTRCVGCHATFKQQVVDAATFDKLSR